jgi:hypothetical protein
MAVDVEGSTARTDTVKARLRRTLYELFEKSLRAAGITPDLHDALIDRGDGILALVHPVDQVPKTRLLDTVVPVLSSELTKHNRHIEHTMRIRIVLHAGEVLYDPRGCFGEAIDLSIRLLDAPATKKHLRQTMEPFVLVVSDDIYRTVIRHGYLGIHNDAFAPLTHAHIAGRRHQGWLYTPNQNAINNLQPLLLCSPELQAGPARSA